MMSVMKTAPFCPQTLHHLHGIDVVEVDDLQAVMLIPVMAFLPSTCSMPASGS